VRLTPADVTAFQAKLKAQGLAALTPQQQAIIKAAVPNVSDQQALLTEMEQASPNSVPTSLVATLQATVPPLNNSGSPGLSVLDTTSGQAVPATAQPSTGPVAGLQEQYINITSDNLIISVSTPNWFVHSGSGTDAIAANSGTNVLDGGTGSNFLTGGSGTDTFFVDDRGPTADIWSTVVGFHAGDSATIWGVTPQDFGLAFADGQGMAGFTGLTLHATASGKPTASLTLAGFSQADMANGRLSVTFGADTASGSAFMFIHGNS
jgi:Ca2+-binding RTX toxin-like protein